MNKIINVADYDKGFKIPLKAIDNGDDTYEFAVGYISSGGDDTIINFADNDQGYKVPIRAFDNFDGTASIAIKGETF